MSTDEREAHLLAQLLQADSLPGVFVSALRPWRDIADEALGLLAEANTPLYVRQSELVRIVHKEDGTPAIEALSDPALKDVLAHAMNFVKISHKGPIHIAPSDDIVRNITARPYWPFTPLEAIIEFPVFRPDGTLILQPGYDTATRLYYAPNPKLVIPPIADAPSDEQIVEAIALIDEVIGEFPFVGLTNFLDNLDDLYDQADSDTQQWAAFLHAWQATYGEREVLAAEVGRDLKEGSLEHPIVGTDLYHALPDELTDIHRGDFRRRLGKALAAHVGSQFDESGLHLVKASTQRRSGAVYWQIAGVQVSQVLKFRDSDFYNQLPPSEHLGGGGRGNFAEKFSDGSTENQPAKPANLQTDEGGDT